jgi:sugar/nucleoside kinase (ribokinase family)|tara:strand:- start:1071 stop:2072 length:1002 start_codon:yes stop_codon:yes gene_type:complete
MKYDICALGNALVDTQYMVSHEFLASVGLEADQMTLVSADEQNEITKKLEDLDAESVSDCGGSATNSLVASSSYGAECHHVCRVSKDDDGMRYLDSLKNAGVYHKGYSEEQLDLPTGKCLILVTPDAKRTMVSMLGVSACMSSLDLDLEAIANSKIFYIEGYMVTSDENFNAVITVLEFLKDKEILKALSLSDPGIVNGFRDKFEQIESYGIDMVFGNDDEAKAFSGKDNLDDAIKFLKEKPFTSVITTGAKGSIVVADGNEDYVSGEQIQPVDTNGAGDMFAGSFMYAYLQGMPLTSCAKFSNYAASKVVETFGPRLSMDGYIKVKNNIQKY